MMEETDPNTFDCLVVGGGIVGAATFYKLCQRFPHLRFGLLEKESGPAMHQTGRNSGVIHSGLYYKPGSLKAKNCIAGREELVEFAKSHQIAHDVCGKVVVATEPSELENLNRIHAIGLENGLSGIERVDGNQIREIEPFVEAIDGLWVPYTGIIDYRRATEVMLEVAKGASPTSKVYFDAKVTAVEANESGTSVLATSRGSFRASRVIFCAGLEADRLAKKSGVKIPERVVGFRGDYYELTEQAKHKVRNLIYPVPNPDFPFLGVHFTRMTDGAVECGPNAVFSFKREGYNKTDFNWKDTLDALTYKGTWSLFLNHAKFGINEYRRAFSKRRFLETLKRMIPSLTLSDIEEGRSGVRALLLAENGDTRDDFRIVSNERYIHVLNAPSPAATASLAIGEQIAREAAQKWAF